MPTIEFLGNGFGATKTVEAPDGGSLVDLCDEHFAPVPFSCRSASCGTCHTEVLVGIELFAPAEPEEQELLDLLGGGKTSRLACQATVRPGPGLIRLKSHLG
ncbi:MAG TPA: 2Fe-2S iron-sulfur cluster-binding protein [Polyangiaceae bacterium]|nr:2Fe-2S iron-sulfur cluster-binding protein [Polyangiaceae bacterium]